MIGDISSPLVKMLLEGTALLLPRFCSFFLAHSNARVPVIMFALKAYKQNIQPTYHKMIL